jgi:hypothetical protein
MPSDNQRPTAYRGALGMDRLKRLIGREGELEQVAATLRECVKTFATPVVGAHHVTCSDESEIECIEVFQRTFVERLLPSLGPEKKAAFRTSNLGARYEQGSARIAEHHYATPESRDQAKAILIKINGHVSVTQTPEGLLYGPMERYHTESNACGALHALLGGVQAPFADDLRQAFTADGNDRIAALLDPQRVNPTHRYLLAAIASARLQATRALADIQEHQEVTPTVYLIVPCVTLNRRGPDGEIVCGFHVADYRGDEERVEYVGLDDDPARYRVTYEDERLQITERGA